MRLKERLKKRLKELYRRELEFIWPRLENDFEDPEELETGWIGENLRREENIEKIREMYRLASKIANAEHERDESIMRRCTTLVGATGITSAFILGFGIVILRDADKFTSLTALFLALLYIIILAYFFKAAYFGLKALGTKTFYVLSPREICNVEADGEKQYLINLTKQLLEFTERNYRVTNERISKYVFGREWFERGIYVLAVLGVFIGLFLIYSHISPNTHFF